MEKHDKIGEKLKLEKNQIYTYLRSRWVAAIEINDEYNNFLA